MKLRVIIFAAIWLVILATSCRQKERGSDMNMIFLHHSTGGVIWKGAQPSIVVRAANKISPRLATALGKKARLLQLLEEYNVQSGKKYKMRETAFPKASPYGWHNYPYDYYNIWVKNAGEKLFMDEPTLEILTKDYNVIIFKHCYPVSNIQPDQAKADIDSDYKSLANYKLQYLALREKLHKFPNTKFIVLTGAAQVKSKISEAEAKRAKEFFSWVVDVWDLPQDNIFVWDLYQLQTEGGMYFKDGYAGSTEDSHPSGEFAAKAAQLFFNRIIDVVDNNGAGTKLTGEKK